MYVLPLVVALIRVYKVVKLDEQKHNADPEGPLKVLEDPAGPK
jgi:hypothetical protein